MVVQVPVSRFRYSVDYELLGVATSGTMLFRSIGGAIGVSLFGAIFASGLDQNLRIWSIRTKSCRGRPMALQTLSPSPRAPILTPSWSPSILGSWWLQRGCTGFYTDLASLEIPLRATASADGIGERSPCRATQLAGGTRAHRRLTRDAGNHSRWRVYASLAARTKLNLPAPELWLLARLGERHPISATELNTELNVKGGEIAGPLNRLCALGYVEKGVDEKLALTATGRAAHDRLVTARRDGLSELLARWEPEKHVEVKALLQRLASTLVAQLPAHRGRTPHGASS